MSKRILSRAVPEHEWPIWTLPLAIIALFSLAALVAYLVMFGLFFGPGLGWFSSTTYNPTMRTDNAHLEVGGALFAIPAHFTRNTHSRSSGVASYIELHALLPTPESGLTAYRADIADRFLRVDADAPLLLIDIRAARQDMEEQQIFDAIYQPYITGGGTVRKDGLQGFQFTASSPYGDKQIFRALPTGAREQRINPPIFLCDTTQNTSPNCESRFPLGQTAQVSYRFKRAHLHEWEIIDSAVKELIRSFRAVARDRK